MMITENSVKLVPLPSWEERNSRHNTKCGSAAVALITTSIQPEPQVRAALIRHTASRTCAGVMNAPVSRTKYPPVPLVSLLLAPSYLLKPHLGLSCVAQGRFCLQRAGAGGLGGLDKWCIYSSWFRMPADRQWTHSAVPKTNSCVQPSLPGRTEEAGHQGFCGQDRGKIPKDRYGRGVGVHTTLE